MPCEPSPTADELRQLISSGELFAAIERCRDTDDTPLLDRCVELHNLGAANILLLSSSSAFDALTGWDFFSIQHFLVAAIPRLNAPLDDMMNFITKLVTKGGNDLAANMPCTAFLDWLSNDLTRASKLIELIASDDTAPFEYLTFALQAHADLSKAQRIAEHFSDRRRLFALTAISRISHHSPADLINTVGMADRLVKLQLDDETKCGLLQAVLSAYASQSRDLSPEALDVVRRCLSPATDLSRYAAATNLNRSSAALTNELIDTLLHGLDGLNVDHKGTIDNLDVGLRTLVKKGFSNRAISFAAKLLVSNKGRLQLHQLDSFSHSLFESAPESLHDAVIHWLLSGELVLGHGLDQLFRKAGRENAVLDISMPRFALTTIQSTHVCRKALGYFFMQPKLAASILVSVLRSAPEELRSQVGPLLFDPLLVNYGGETRDYLDSLPASDASQPEVSKALELAKNYVEGIRSAGDIKELIPSTRQQEAVRTQWHDQMQTAAKEAQEQSVLLKMVKHSILLYGRQSLSYVTDHSGEKRPVEIQMQSHHFGFEMPRQETIDPIGVDEMLRVFRSERLPR